MTVWGVFQLAGVKVKLGLSTFPSVVLSDVTPRLTSAVGWLFRTTVNVAVPPASVVVNPVVGVTVTPAISLSVIVTLWLGVVPNPMPVEGLLIVKVAVSAPSTRKSSLTMMVTCPVLLPSGIVI
ncbi:hypothetical protein E5S67_05879 [Microcoleus sp. IPMA8]|uniref:Uncharacterized protein n=1 Tax=Microcoleus asticus IPMA8 TaxID=2563858 RepID=A0ABX2D612_9CYAN|nr:hypothetical protein [Microcoleus asticus IPMA8]